MIPVLTLRACISHRLLPYVTECRGPVDLIVRADAGVLCLQSEGEGCDVENQDVGSISDLSGV